MGHKVLGIPVPINSELLCILKYMYIFNASIEKLEKLHAISRIYLKETAGLSNTSDVI